MALTERLALLISLDANGAVRGLENVGKAADRNLGKAESKIDRTAKHMQKAGVGMMAAAGLAATGLYQAGQAASDLEQAVGGTEAVFKEASGTIDAYAKNAADNAGLSERAFREATTGIGGNLKRMGFDVDEAAERSSELTQVAADLAATYGGTTAEAVAALGAAFRGEADPAERFNLNLKASAVNAKAVELGLAASTAEIDENAKAQALLALITEQSADAQGQFAREAGTAAGQMQIASANFEDAKAQLGEAVAPIMAEVAGGLADLAGGFTKVNEATGGAASKIASFGTIGLGALGGLSFVTGKLIEMRDTFASLPPKVQMAGRALGAIAFAAISYELIRWGNSLNDARVNLEAIQDIAGRTPDEGLGEFLEFLGNQADGMFGDQGKRRAEEWFRTLSEQAPAAAEALLEAGAGSDELADALDRVGLSVGDLAPILDEEISATQRSNEVQRKSAEIIDGTAEATEGLITPTADLADETAGLADEAEEAGQAFSDLSDELSGLFDPLLSAVDAMNGLTEAHEKVAEAEQAVTDATADLRWQMAEHGRDSKEAKDAADRLADAERGLEDAKRGTIDAVIDQETAMFDLRAEVENGNTRLDDAIRKLDGWVAQGAITEEAASKVKDELAKVAWMAASIPSDVGISVRLDTTQWLKDIAAFYDQNPDMTVSIGLGGQGGYAAGGLVSEPKYMAMGGPSGTDTVPAWLTPGEFVMRKSAVDQLGVGFLSALNSGGSAASMIGGDLVVQVIPGEDPYDRARRELDRMRYLVGAS